LSEQTEGLYTFKKTFTQATRFVFQYPEPRELDEIRADVYALRNFLTLGVGEPVNVTRLSGARNPLPKDRPALGRQVEIFYQHIENRRVEEARHHHAMVFLLPDIQDRFQEHIVRWFEGATALGRVLDLYFGTLHVEFVYLESRFMNFVQAVEGFHRRRLEHTRYDRKTYSSYRKEILDGLSGEAKAVAERLLTRGNDVSLGTRIEDVLAHLGEPATSIVLAGAARAKLDAAGFAARVAEIRNIYAHNLKRAEPDVRELSTLTFQVRTITEALLLAEVGFEPQVIDEKLRAAERFRLIQAIAAG
jgi:hypothetical protein